MQQPVQASPADKDAVIQELRDEVDYLKSQLVRDDIEIPEEWGIAPACRKVLLVLLTRDFMTIDAAMAALYSGRAGDEPGSRIVNTYVCHLRRLFRPKGITIETRWGRGFYLTPEMKKKILEHCRFPGREEAEGAS